MTKRSRAGRSEDSAWDADAGRLWRRQHQLSAAAENRVEQRSKDGQNLDVSTVVEANAGATDFEITRAQAELTIDLKFSHEIAEGNTADYNDFTVTVSGPDGQEQSYRIGADEGEHPLYRKRGRDQSEPEQGRAVHGRSEGSGLPDLPSECDDGRQ